MNFSVQGKTDFQKGLLSFILSALLLVLAGYLNGTFIVGSNEYYSIVSPEISEELLVKIIPPIWLSCIVPVLTNFLFVFIISLVVYIGYYLTIRQNYGTIFKCVSLAHIVFAVFYIVFYLELIILPFPDCSIGFSSYPLSLASFFDVCRLDMWMVPTLSYVNFFEIAYMALLAYLLSKNIKQDYKQSLKMVLYTYGLMLLLNVVCLSAGYVYMSE